MDGFLGKTGDIIGLECIGGISVQIIEESIQLQCMGVGQVGATCLKCSTIENFEIRMYQNLQS